jgi:dienelactone hydrolase
MKLTRGRGELPQLLAHVQRCRSAGNESSTSWSAISVPSWGYPLVCRSVFAVARFKARVAELSATLVLSVGAAACSSTPSTPIDGGSDVSSAGDAGCFDAALGAGDFELPTPTGPYGVARGVRRTIVDTTRDVNGLPLDADGGADAGGSRLVAVELWYPTDPCPVTSGVFYYLDPPELTVFGFNFAQGAHIHIHAREHVPFAAGLGAQPVLVFSPGYGAFARMYQSYFEELASHGYIVAGISHVLYSTVAILADGTAVAGTHQDASTIGDIDAAVWLADARAVIDQLAQANSADPSGEVTNHLDLGKIGMFGHSFGGSNSLNVAFADARVKAAVNLDGTIYGAAATGTLATPFFLFQSAHPADGTWTPVYEGATGGAYWAILAGSQHEDFSDLAPLDEGLNTQLFTAPMGPIEGVRAIQVVNDYLLAFFDQTLFGTSSALLTGPAPDFPEVIDFQKR